MLLSGGPRYFNPLVLLGEECAGAKLVMVQILIDD